MSKESTAKQLLDILGNKSEMTIMSDIVYGLNFEYEQLQQENEELKQKLNWIAFGDDSELALRYLRKIGYVDFDEERKVYINKHNNEPFWINDEEEKNYYIKEEELDEYTKQLEYTLNELESWLEYQAEHTSQQHNYWGVLDKLKELKGNKR